MKFDIARQPLVPAFLTLAALAVAALWNAGEPVSGAIARIGGGIFAGGTASGTGAAGQGIATAGDLVVALPGELLARFQAAHILWSRWIGGLLLLYAGMTLGRMSVRYNLYSASTCIAIPLYGIVLCGIGSGGDFLPSLTASALLACSVRHFARSFCNGYGFDALFRASLAQGVLPLVSPAAGPLWLLVPLALVLFRRTLREAAVAAAGLLLPALAFCYLNWAAGGSVSAPAATLFQAVTTGSPLALFPALPLPTLLFAGGILALDVLAILLFLSDRYAVGTKPRFILIYIISALVLTLVSLCGPAAGRSDLALAAVPSALLLPLVFVRSGRAITLPLYLILLAAGVWIAFLQ